MRSTWCFIPAGLSLGSDGILLRPEQQSSLESTSSFLASGMTRGEMPASLGNKALRALGITGLRRVGCQERQFVIQESGSNSVNLPCCLASQLADQECPFAAAIHAQEPVYFSREMITSSPVAEVSPSTAVSDCRKKKSRVSRMRRKPKR